jgi:hypothetical protein
MCLMLTVGCLYHWIKSKKLAINLYRIEVGLIELKYTKLYTTVENVFYCANITSYGNECKFAISIEVYHMSLICSMYVKLSLVLANTRIHIVHRTYLKIICINVLYPVYSNRFGHVNITLTHARLTACPPPSANRKTPHAESLQTVYVYRQYVQASVLPQFASPPGGECTYYVCSCINLTRIICSITFHILPVFLEKTKKRNCIYSICVKPTLILLVRNTNSAIKFLLRKFKNNLCRNNWSRSLPPPVQRGGQEMALVYLYKFQYATFYRKCRSQARRVSPVWGGVPVSIKALCALPP